MGAILKAPIPTESTEEHGIQPVGREIGIDEWGTTRRVLFTRNASTCVVLAALNESNGTGLLGHFPGVMPGYAASGERKFEQALAALADLGPSSATQICLTGTGIYFRDEECDTGSDRQHAETRVHAVMLGAGIPASALTVDWLWGDELVEAAVDCREGKIITDPFMEYIPYLD